MKAKAPAKRLPPARSSALAATRSGFAPVPATWVPAAAGRPARARAGRAGGVGGGVREPGGAASGGGVDAAASVDALAVVVEDAGAAGLAPQRHPRRRPERR